MDELSRSAGWPFAGAFIGALISGPVVKRLAIRFDFFDRPDGGLKPHDRPIPYLGGLAIYLGWLAAIATAIWASASNSDAHWLASSMSRPLLWIALGGTVMMLTGLIDDRRHIPPMLRLAIQAAVSGILILGGIGAKSGLSLLNGWIDPSASAVTAAALPALSVVIAAFIIAAACNSTNLIDGMDGLCAGVVLISAVGFAAVTGALVANGAIESTGAMFIITIAAAAAGACSAFLLFNFNPASMFMGDSGSLLLGFSVATTLVLLAELAGWRGLIAGAISFGFPFFDTALAVGRRWLNKKPLFTGDRSHFYDQIRDRGYSVKQTVVGCYGLQFAFAATGVICAIAPLWAVICIAAGLPIAGWLACRRFGLLRIERT